MDMAQFVYHPSVTDTGGFQGLAAVNSAAVDMGVNHGFMNVMSSVLLQIKSSQLEPRGGAQNVLSLVPEAALSQRSAPASPWAPCFVLKGCLVCLPILTDLWTKESGQELKWDSRAGTRLPATVLGLFSLLSFVKARPEAQGSACTQLLIASCDLRPYASGPQDTF